MKNDKSEYDLDKIRLKEELKYVDSEINKIHEELSKLSNNLRWKYLKRQRILSKMGYDSDIYN